jgi:hypothetical protein
VFADGPFWELHVQAKPGFLLRSVSLTGSVVGQASVGIIDSPIGFLQSPSAAAFFPPGTAEGEFSLAGGYFVGPEDPVAAYDVILRFATVSAVGEPGIAAFVAGAALAMMVILRLRA